MRLIKFKERGFNNFKLVRVSNYSFLSSEENEKFFLLWPNYYAEVYKT